MARPEGVLVAVTLVGVRLWSDRRDRRALQLDLTALSVFAALGAVYFAWRTAYFGYLLPNTFYAKVGANPRQVLTGLRHLFEFFNRYGQFVPSLAILALASPRRPSVHGVALLIAVYLLYIVAIGGGTQMDSNYRYVVPIWPMVTLLLVPAFERVRAALRGSPPGSRQSPAEALIFPALLASAAFWILRPSLTRTRDRSASTGELHEFDCWRRAGQWFRENAPPGATIAISAAGTLPYFSDLPVVDMLGLNDVAIAHLPCPALGVGERGHERSFPVEILARKPKYIVLDTRLTATPEEVNDWSRAIPIIHDMSSEPGFREGYRFRSIEAGTMYFNFYERRADD
jgi:hypothetical protein